MAIHIVSNRVLINKTEAMIQVDIKPEGFPLLLLMFDLIFCVVLGILSFFVPVKDGWSISGLWGMSVCLLLMINLAGLWRSYLGVSWEITPIEAVANYKIFNFRWSYSVKYVTRLVYQPWKREAQGGHTNPCLWLETDRGRRYMLAEDLSEREIQEITDTLSTWFGVPISPESRFV
jgi:hypothetical protein